MKRPIFIMLVLVAIAFAGPMLMKKPDGTAFMATPWESLNSAKEDANTNTKQSFYKWQDDNGNWHYSDQPQVGKNTETITVNTNTNLIQGLRAEKEDVKVVEEKKLEAKEEAPSLSLPMTVPLEKVSKMLDDANNMQEIMDNRNKQIEQASRGR
jgi:hypothetical protein